MFGFKPRWFDRVLARGVPALATVVSDPKAVMKGVAGYRGGERYFDVVVRVDATYDGTHEQKMKIVLADDVVTLLKRRVRPPS